MKDLRLINIKDDGVIELTPWNLHEPIKGREAAIQRVVIGLITTPGTMMFAPSWGGGAYRLFLSNRTSKKQVKHRVEAVIQHTKQSVLSSEPAEDDYRVTLIEFGGISFNNDRGFSVDIEIGFANSTAADISIPSGTFASP